MRKLLFSLFALTLLSFASQAQGWQPSTGERQFSVGVGLSDWGVPVYADFQFQAIDQYVTLGPRVSYASKNYYYNAGGNRYGYSARVFTLGVVGNYHFSGMINVPEQLDIYAGLEFGYASWNVDWDNDNDFDDPVDNGLYGDLRVGTKYFFNPKFAAMFEVGFGSRPSGALVGVTLGL